MLRIIGCSVKVAYVVGEGLGDLANGFERFAKVSKLVIQHLTSNALSSH